MPISGKTIIKKLRKQGWELVSQTGSHVKLKKGGVVTIVPVHSNKDLPKGTIKALRSKLERS